MKKAFSYLLFAVVLPVSVVAVTLTHYQTISDYIALRNYQPPARIAQIRDDLQLTKTGETLFYVHDPQIVSSDVFSTSCPVREKTIVLGCYYTNTSIFIYDVQDSRAELQGVEEVTAAHEMLHAAYDRLNENERKEVVALLEIEYSKLSDDSRVKQNIDEYGPQGDTVVQNELHSIIGTEIADISDELEEYYTRYFEDRQVVVTIAENYAEVFRDLERQIEEYDSELSVLAESIDEEESIIRDYQEELRNRAAELEMLEDNPSQYNQRVGSYNAVVNVYNATVESYKLLINQYNDLVNKRNDISAEQRTLYDAIDARVETKEE